MDDIASWIWVLIPLAAIGIAPFKMWLRVKEKQMDSQTNLAAEKSAQYAQHMARVEERLRLLDLEPTLLKLYESGNLPQEAASEISRIKDFAQQTRLVQMVARGQLQGYAAIRSAVQTVLNETSAVDLFGTATPKATEENILTVSAMERKIESVVGMVAGGWRDGECVVASKVAPDRGRLMADKLAAIKRSISIMESQLRATAAQAEIVLGDAAASTTTLRPLP